MVKHRAETHGATRPMDKRDNRLRRIDHFPTGITDSGIWHTARRLHNSNRILINRVLAT